MIRVLVVDDHPVLRAGLEAVLRAEPGFRCVGGAEDGAAMWGLLRRTRPDVVVLDHRLGDEDGIELCRALRAEPEPPSVLLYTADPNSSLERGAGGRGRRPRGQGRRRRRAVRRDPRRGPPDGRVWRLRGSGGVARRGARGSPRAPRLARLRRVGQQLAQHVAQDPAVAEVVGLLGRVDPDAGLERTSPACTWTSRGSSPAFSGSARPVIVNSSSPVRPSESAVSPSGNCSGSTPMPTRLERWMRSKVTAITARTPSRLVPLAAQSRDEPEPYSLPPSTTSGMPSAMYCSDAS